MCNFCNVLFDIFEEQLNHGGYVEILCYSKIRVDFMQFINHSVVSLRLTFVKKGVCLLMAWLINCFRKEMFTNYSCLMFYIKLGKTFKVYQ